MRFMDYSPNYVDVENEPDEFPADTAALLQLPKFTRVARSPEFSHFAQTKYGDRWLIFAHYTDHEEWAIGYTDTKPDLPDHVPEPLRPGWGEIAPGFISLLPRK